MTPTEGPLQTDLFDAAGRPTFDTGPTPVIRLFVDRVTIDRGVGAAPRFDEEEVPLVALRFDYKGVRVSASDPPFAAGVQRELGVEAEAKRLLESFGAVDLDCLEEHAIAPGVEAHYLVACDGDVHDYCNFGAYVLPQLRGRGWVVEVADRYPYAAVAGSAPWYADVDSEGSDWFALELGIELDGQRINLVPVLLELLEDGDNLRSLTRSGRRAVALALDTHRYLTVPPEQLRVIVQVMIELYDKRAGAKDGKVVFSEEQAMALSRLDQAFDAQGLSLAWEGHTPSSAGVFAEPDEVDPPKGLKATLRSYQAEGLAWLQHLARHDVGGILADDMGLGKTLQTIAHLAKEHERPEVRQPSLVIAPTSLVYNWEREIQKFAPGLRPLVIHGSDRHRAWEKLASADVLITSYPILVRDEDRFAELPLHLLALDEAHTIKNTRSQVHRAAKRLSARQRIGLSGTPVENHLGELWSLFDFVQPGLLGDELGFQRNFRVPIEKGGDEERLAVLRERVAPFILRRVKDDVAKELPPKTELMRPVSLTGRQRELYESIRVAAHAQVRQTIQHKGLAGSTISILDALMKLRQVCCDPRLLKLEAARTVARSAKTSTLFELVTSQLGQGRRILIFSQFTAMLRLIGQGLAERRIGYLELTGASKHRQDLIDRFEGGEADVFLISLKAGGVGLTLTSADTVIHYDPWWNPAIQDQATDRAYRIGQTKPVFVHNLFVAGSVEERMILLQHHKRRLANAMLGAGAPNEPLFSEEDLGLLFAPLGG